MHIYDYHFALLHKWNTIHFLQLRIKSKLLSEATTLQDVAPENLHSLRPLVSLLTLLFLPSLFPASSTCCSLSLGDSALAVHSPGILFCWLAPCALCFRSSFPHRFSLITLSKVGSPSHSPSEVVLCISVTEFTITHIACLLVYFLFYPPHTH